jgi:hypothetical protein
MWREGVFGREAPSPALRTVTWISMENSTQSLIEIIKFIRRLSNEDHAHVSFFSGRVFGTDEKYI